MDEQEILRLRDAVATAERDEARLRSTADAEATRVRESGADLTSPEAFAKIDEAYKPADAARDELSAVRARYTRALEIAGRAHAESRETRTREAEADRRNPAMRLIEGEAYKRLRESGALKTGPRSVQMDATEIITREEVEASGLRLRTLFTNANNVGSGLLTPDYTNKLVDVLVRKVRLLDLVTVGTTDTDTVDWIIEQARTDAAAPTAYNTAVPESAYGFAHTTTQVKRAGHFVPATKGILADAGQTRTLLSTRLINGLERAIETQIFSGDGTGENLTGFASTGIVTNVVDVTTDAGGSDIDAMHKAITKVRVASVLNIEPTHVLISPADFEKVVLSKDSTGRYLYGGDEPKSVWGLAPVVTTLVADGTPWVGNFGEACNVWLRQGVEVLASDQHQDYFLKGLVALMAETRLAYATTRASAICKVTSF